MKTMTHLKKIAFSIFMMFALVISFEASAFTTQKDISFGNLSRDKYDLYLPKNITDNTPVLFFIYGGGWTSGNRSRYNFVGKSFAKEGIITAIPDYRLYPEVTFPAFVEDTARAFAAVRQRFPNRKIFVAGHSAGAQIGSLLTLDKRYLTQVGYSACNAIAGFIGIAGPYDFLPLRRDKFKKIFPEEVRQDSQAVNFAASNNPPVLLLHGQRDRTVEAADSVSLSRKLKAVGNPVEAKIYKNVGHIGILTALGALPSFGTPTKSDMLQFIKARSNLPTGC